MDAQTHVVFPTVCKKVSVKKVTLRLIAFEQDKQQHASMYRTLRHTLQHACFFIVIHLGGSTTPSNTCNAMFRVPVHHKHLTSGHAMGMKILARYQSVVTDPGHHSRRGQHVTLFRLQLIPSVSQVTGYKSRNPRYLPINCDHHSCDWPWPPQL